MEPHHPDDFDWKRLKKDLKAKGGTKLYAFRAHLRGKLHFSKTTNLAEARWILGLPIETIEDKTLPGGWRYGPITMEVVEKWVAKFYEFYKRVDAPPIAKAG